jgi:hypothetical protein
LVELVKSGIYFRQGFKEPHMRKVANNDVLDLISIGVSIQQLYSHVRMWRFKWNVISRMKNEGNLKGCDSGTCFIL